MYVYKITNLINDKGYIGITNNPKKRWENHKCNNDPSMVIAKAIKKYGKENFSFEILLSNVSLDEIDSIEQEYIEKYQTHVSTGKGYNVSRGGRYNILEKPLEGVDNGRALLTEEEVRYIKSHRNLPEYVLYEKFAEKITYETFRNIYLDKTYKNIPPTVDCYPKNFEFSCQFNNSKLDYGEVVELREAYDKGIYWKDIYEQRYKEKYQDPWTFWNIYCGNMYKLVKPEVFTEENKQKHTQFRICSGEKNGRAKLKKEEVIQMRKDFESKKKTRKEIQDQYKDRVSSTSINNILRYATWKNI